jgi:hypothetical protein
MSDDLDNVIDLATRREDGKKHDVIHTLVCLGLQREIYEHRITSLKNTNRALLIITITAYILGMYSGYYVASSLGVGFGL